MLRNLLLLLAIPFFTINISAQNLYFPPLTGDAWESISPDDLDWCQEKIDSLYDFLDFHNSKGFIVLKDGKIVLEKYFDSFTKDSIWYYASAGKSVVAMLTGIAQSQGILDIHDATNEYLGTGWTECTPEQEDSITIWHQITMTTGLDEEKNTPDKNCLDPECLQYLVTPGTRWDYFNAPYRLTQDVLAAASGQNFNLYFRQALASKIGMSGLWFNYVLYGRVRDAARFGLFTLAKGNWDGNPIMPDLDYYNDMVNTSQPMNKSYGYLWWLNGKESAKLPGLQFDFPGSLIPNAPDDMFAALGKDDQKIYVVPSQNMVVVRMGESAGGFNPTLSSFDNELWARISDLECTSNNKLILNPNEFEINPNPVEGAFNLESPFPILSLNISTLDGKEIGSERGNGSNFQNVSLLTNAAPGIYILRIETENGFAIKKIVRN
ncbi:MAG: serine hydrolase [Saprospiraceae bacterium]